MSRHLGCKNLTGARIHGQVELAPTPMAAGGGLTRIVAAMDLQSRTINEKMNRALPSDRGTAETFERLRTSR